MYENIIAIPYRDREEHLEYFITNTVPLIQKCLPNSKIVVVEQNEGKLFNRGAVLNVAFREYKNKTKYFYTHDVDINPTKEAVQGIYTRDNIDIYRIYSAHTTSLGGVIKVQHDTMININGFPNYIWGWGIEDRALYFRSIIKQHMIVTNNDKRTFKILKHMPSSSGYGGVKKQYSDMWRKANIDKLDDEQKDEMIMSSGLNNLEYTIIDRKMIHDIVEIIKVDI